ncbi:conserved hypothetical protein [Chloroherpeton thalassium ATCC 35110]|uniref:Uncharacterized protein n=1 Tax=Chloroherpeton thalassium (strain ATCC 35110 / GB-78) TaxID=517418 RepID=B3QSG3_CHLT3|nr:conserved hypothetical protein [Chloroherpeton thalassium ATCC 35110]
MMTLSEIKQSHRLTYQYFSECQHGERWLQRIVELDQYWEQIGKRSTTQVVFSSDALPKNVRINGHFDLIYAGSTLGTIHAAAMAAIYKKSVLLFDKHTPAKTHRDWNISKQELLALAQIGLLTEKEIESAITKKYQTGFVEFASTEPPTRLYLEHVLDCAIDSDTILRHCLEKMEGEKNLVLGKTTFNRCFQCDDGIVVEVTSDDGRLEYYKAKVMMDAMGILSPIALELNNGKPQTHICPTVGTVASGLLDVDYDIGEILVSTEPEEYTATGARQLIWEGFPASNTEMITYLFFYDRIDSNNDKSLLNLFETYFQKLPTYKRPGADFKLHKPVFGIIPAYHHNGMGKTRETAADRILLLGDAATLSSPLTFCGFGSMVRNLARTTKQLNTLLDEGRCTKSDLERVSAYEENVAIMSNLMKFMCFEKDSDPPNFVNDLMNVIMKVLKDLPPRYGVSLFRDEMALSDFNTLILTVAKKYPKIFEITFRKLGVSGSLSWIQNWLGWLTAPKEK